MIKYNNVEWINKQGALVPRHAPHIITTLTIPEQNELLKKSGAYFLRWNSDFDVEKTDFWYIIKDSFDGFNELSSKMRNQVKKGMKNNFTKQIDKRILLEHGYEVYIEATKRYDTFESIMSKEEFYNYIDLLDERYYEFWGVFEKENNILVGYAQNYINNNTCFYEEMFYHPKYLKNYSSYVLFFDLNKYYLEDRKFLFVHDGSRSLSHDTTIQEFLIKKFKFRKAYCNMKISYRRDVRLIVKLLYPWKGFIDKLNINIFRKISVLLKHEEIRKCNASL